MEMFAFPDVDVVIVARDAGDRLSRAVASVQGQVAPGRVVVIDVASSDGSIEELATAHPTVRIVHTEDNGLSASNNVGIASTAGEDVLFLSPEVELEERSLDSLVTRIRANRSAAVVAPKILDPDGRQLAGSFGQFPTLSRVLIAHLNRIAHRMSGGILRPRAEISQTLPVDWVTGECMLVRRSAIHKIGPMDEGFRRYLGDIEWCHRMHDNGFTVLIEPIVCCTRQAADGGGVPAAARGDYRGSLERYCRLYGLWGLSAAVRVGVTVPLVAGGRG
jgi:GT2 family glycosyltransferase